MNLDSIIEKYSKFELQQGIEVILNLKHNLSLLIMQISKHIKTHKNIKKLTKNINKNKINTHKNIKTH